MTARRRTDRWNEAVEGEKRWMRIEYPEAVLAIEAEVIDQAIAAVDRVEAAIPQPGDSRLIRRGDMKRALEAMKETA